MARYFLIITSVCLVYSVCFAESKPSDKAKDIYSLYRTNMVYKILDEMKQEEVDSAKARYDSLRKIIIIKLRNMAKNIAVSNNSSSDIADIEEAADLYMDNLKEREKKK